MVRDTKTNLRRCTMVALRERFRIVGLQSQQGAALVIAVMILLILTVLGIYAVTTSTLETKIAGNERVIKDAFYAADGGIDYGRYVIALVLNDQSLAGVNANQAVSSGTTLEQEILGDPIVCIDPDPKKCSPWVEPTIGHSDMEIHIDRIRAEEASGYSGEFGAAKSEKKTSIYYRVDSVSHGIADASSEIEATYRHVLQ